MYGIINRFLLAKNVYNLFVLLLFVLTADLGRFLRPVGLNKFYKKYSWRLAPTAKLKKPLFSTSDTIFASSTILRIFSAFEEPMFN